MRLLHGQQTVSPTALIPLLCTSAVYSTVAPAHWMAYSLSSFFLSFFFWSERAGQRVSQQPTPQNLKGKKSKKTKKTKKQPSHRRSCFSLNVTLESGAAPGDAAERREMRAGTAGEQHECGLWNQSKSVLMNLQLWFKRQKLLWFFFFFFFFKIRERGIKMYFGRRKLQSNTWSAPL